MIRAVSELIGDPYILRLDQIFVKPDRNGLGTSWHQDNAYFNIENPLKNWRHGLRFMMPIQGMARCS